MKKESYNFSFVSIMIFTLVICVYLVLVNSFLEYIEFHPLQYIVAKTVYLIQQALGINVELEGLILHYPGVLDLNITLLCTGVNEILFFSLILLGFIGVSLKTKFKGYTLFFPIIILENIARIVLIQPLAIVIGKKAAVSFHNFSFKYGQAIFVILLAIIWFQLFAKQEFKKSVQNYKLAKQSRLKLQLRRKKH
jgi:exosortase/archaeosortase family protein